MTKSCNAVANLLVPQPSPLTAWLEGQAHRRPVPPVWSTQPVRIDWDTWALALHRGDASAFTPCFRPPVPHAVQHQDRSRDRPWDLPFWVALHAPADDAPLDQVRPVLEACLAQGVSLYGETGHLRALADVQDPAKFAWWLDQGGDPGVPCRLSGDSEPSCNPAWFGLIDHARLDLLEVLRERPQWSRLARQRGHQQAGAFERWAQLVMTRDHVCGGDNPDARTPDMGWEPGDERPDGSVEWTRVPLPEPGLTTDQRVAQALRVWRWLDQHVPQPDLEPMWCALWQHNLHHERVLHPIWKDLLNVARHGLAPAAALPDAWPRFLRTLSPDDWQRERALGWWALHQTVA